MTALPQLEAALEEFKRLLAPEVAARLVISEPYRLIAYGNQLPHWPRNWGDVWKRPTDAAVYFLFDAADALQYIGHTSRLGVRFGKYFKSSSRPCEIIDPAFKDKVCYVRAVFCDDDIKILAPSLEWLLIARTAPPINQQRRTPAATDAS